MDSLTVHRLTRVRVGAVMAMGLPVASALAQVRLWFNEEIESA